jgi:RHS repeat-associated protein
MPTSTGKTLCLYGYDPLDRQTQCAPLVEEAIQRFHCKTLLATEVQGTVQRSIMQYENHLFALRKYERAKVETALVVTDQQRSVLIALGATPPHMFTYTPYGYCPPIQGLLSVLGFNGEQPDRVTGHYHLGNGYRQFNPVLMRFNNPDSWSPFGQGGLNAYAYCEGEPIMNTDPDGYSLLQSLIVKPFKNMFSLRESSSAIVKKLIVGDVVKLDGKSVKTPAVFLGDDDKLQKVEVRKRQYEKLAKVGLKLDQYRVKMERENYRLIDRLGPLYSGAVERNHGGGLTNSSRQFNYFSDNANSAPMRKLLGSMEKLDDVAILNRELSERGAVKKNASIRGVVAG